MGAFNKVIYNIDVEIGELVSSAVLLTPHFSLQHSCDQIQFWPDKYCSNKNTEYL